MLLEEPADVEAIYGRPFTLECRFFSSPAANVTWENPSLLGDEYRTEVDALGVGRLTIERELFFILLNLFNLFNSGISENHEGEVC
jgi:hypothetical protein